METTPTDERKVRSGGAGGSNDAPAGPSAYLRGRQESMELIATKYPWLARQMDASDGVRILYKLARDIMFRP